MELQQAFDHKRLAVSVLPPSIVYSLDVYGSICSKVLAKVPYSVLWPRALFWTLYGKCVLSLLVSCVFCYDYLGVSFGAELSAQLLFESLGGCSLVRS